jgi:hypothetical protein
MTDKEAIVIGAFDEAVMRKRLSGVAVEMPALDLVAHWRRCGMSADFLAGYMAYDFENRPVATNVLSTVINEVLENAAKFSADKRRQVRILVAQEGDVVRIEATNVVRPAQAEALRARLTEVLASDPEEKFLQHMENAAQAPPGAPGIGFVVLRKDYGAQLGARIVPRDDGLLDVSVQVAVPSAQVDER